MIKVKVKYNDGTIKAIMGVYNAVKRYLKKNDKQIQYFDILF